MSRPADRVTVVVPTFRRPEGLARALAGLARQDDPEIPWDVLVVDNDDPPGAAGVFQASAAALPAGSRLVREPQRGASHARNRGVAETAGSITAFLDDDVEPAPEWLRTLLTPLLGDVFDGVGGRVVLDPTVPRPRWFDESGLGGYLAAHDLGPEERALAPDEFVITANAAFRTDRLVMTGGMDTDLGPRAGVPLVNDDVMLCLRFAEAGGRLGYVPDATVVHELPPSRLTPRYLLRRAYWQGRSDWIMLARTIGRRGAAEQIALWGVHEAGRRRREGLTRRSVLFHGACDVARLIGSVREAVPRLASGVR